MFGYVVVNKSEMKFREFDQYHSFYCGLCRELRERYGIAGQISLTYDMTFVVLLLTGLYELRTQKGTSRCVMHPVRKECIRKNEAAEYAADLNVLLAYYKAMDDWKDEKDLPKRTYALLLEKGKEQAAGRYPGKAEVIETCLREMSECEKRDERNLDVMAGLFGRILAEVFAWKQGDVWEAGLRRFGFYLGKFIYILDAYDDVEKDLKENSYNPFKDAYKEPDFEKKVREILTMMISEACREFERFPILVYADILRNILYSGVWTRFVSISEKRRRKAEEVK